MEFSFGERHIWFTMSTSLLTMLLLWLAYTIVWTVEKFVITPIRIKRIMNRQGVKGPPFHLFMGNLLDMFKLQKAGEDKELKTGDYDIVSHVMPFHVKNCQAYGKSYLWWFRWEAMITITDLDIMKQVWINKDHMFIKNPMVVKLLKPIIGRGLVTIDGEEWAFHRQIVNPAFHYEKLKVQTTTLQKSLMDLLKE